MTETLNGMLDPNGTAVVIKFSDVLDLEQFLCSLCKIMLTTTASNGSRQQHQIMGTAPSGMFGRWFKTLHQHMNYTFAWPINLLSGNVP